MNTSRAVAVLTATKCAKLGEDISKEISTSRSKPYRSLEIGPLTRQTPLSPESILISADHILEYNGSGLVIFTSGTTGPPKGAMRRRSTFDSYAQRFADMYSLGSKDVVMHFLPVHHVTGIVTSFLPYLVSGGCIEFHAGGFNPAVVWDRWREKDLTLFSGVPTIYMRLMHHYEANLANLPEKERNEYIDGACNFRILTCGTSALPRPLQRKWLKLARGKRILERYGMTETSTVFTIHPEDKDCPDVRARPTMSVFLGKLRLLLARAPSANPSLDLMSDYQKERQESCRSRARSSSQGG